MRISDWSSDVCSSDLVAFAPAGSNGRMKPCGRAAGMLQIGPRDETGRRPVTLAQHGEAYGRMAAVRQVSDLRVLVDGWRRAGERVGIGSAECRERGCQYV